MGIRRQDLLVAGGAGSLDQVHPGGGVDDEHLPIRLDHPLHPDLKAGPVLDVELRLRYLRELRGGRLEGVGARPRRDEDRDLHQVPAHHFREVAEGDGGGDDLHLFRSLLVSGYAAA